MTQEEALAILESGASVLLTGAAGSGKTYVLNKFIKRAKQQGKYVAVTATTGLAATHLNGTTIHAWAGIGVHDDISELQLHKFSKSRRDLLLKADILIIDEISMLHDYRLDLVDIVTRSIREDERPFGGLQVILSGDFFQLPPVNRNSSKQGSFVTESEAWKLGIFTVCYLDTQYRQSDDQAYTDILNGIRAGVLTRSQLDILQQRKEVTVDPWSQSTRLLTTNADVDTINAVHLSEIDAEPHVYEMTTKGGKQYVEQLMRSCLAPQVLELKQGAQVMCIKNSTDRKYVNGSLGVVVGFDEDTDYPIIELVNGRQITVEPDMWELMDGDKSRAKLMQLPVRLAWAITVHKSQGMTLDAARIDLGRAFVEGMGYVALSRVRGLKHLQLDGLNNMALRVSPYARQIDKTLRARSEQALIDHAETIQKWQEKPAVEGKEEAAKPVIDQLLYDELRMWRQLLAAENGKPAYIIAHNTVLEAIAQRKPQNKTELRRIKGMGDAKVAQYGDAIVEIVAKHVAN